MQACAIGILLYCRRQLIPSLHFALHHMHDQLDIDMILNITLAGVFEVHVHRMDASCNAQCMHSVTTMKFLNTLCSQALKLSQQQPHCFHGHHL